LAKIWMDSMWATVNQMRHEERSTAA
jgi:hypothetical protein